MGRTLFEMRADDPRAMEITSDIASLFLANNIVLLDELMKETAKMESELGWEKDADSITRFLSTIAVLPSFSLIHMLPRTLYGGCFHNQPRHITILHGLVVLIRPRPGTSGGYYHRRHVYGEVIKIESNEPYLFFRLNDEFDDTPKDALLLTSYTKPTEEIQTGAWRPFVKLLQLAAANPDQTIAWDVIARELDLA